MNATSHVSYFDRSTVIRLSISEYLSHRSYTGTVYGNGHTLNLSAEYAEEAVFSCLFMYQHHKAVLGCICLIAIQPVNPVVSILQGPIQNQF